ncbi:hypothetical protein [Candidatus Electrothrix sp.]|uniref:hypothetical protein n=1 Tax=Candidatus Electrothrix sp. TaxID=2170559 RepID=UPI004055AADC
MISARKHMRAAVFVSLFFVAISGLVLQNMPNEAVAQEDAAQEESGAVVQENSADASQEEPGAEQEAISDAGQEESGAEEQEAPADAAPTTSDAEVECYESRKDATRLTKKDNVNPKYGYPNVKCSPTTKAVLWYGDPYDDTEPIGDTPSFGDYTDGDFAQAVIRPRTKHLKTIIQNGGMQCSGCHPGADPATQKNDPRELMMHQDIVSDALVLEHGRGAIWCFDCHNAANRDTLVNHRGDEVSFNESYKLCGSCHGSTYSEWRMGLHGKRTGEWRVGGKKRWWTCTECHNPHTVEEHRFDPVKPEPPPALPRGMSEDDYKGAGNHGGH